VSGGSVVEGQVTSTFDRRHIMYLSRTASASDDQQTRHICPSIDQTLSIRDTATDYKSLGLCSVPDITEGAPTVGKLGHYYGGPS